MVVPTAPNPPGFTNSNASVNITALVAGVITVRFGCDPGTVVESAHPSTIVRTDPAPTFASTQVTNPKCKKLKKQLKKAKKAKNQKKVKKIKKKMRKLGC